jgi:hypothetical protein
MKPLVSMLVSTLAVIAMFVGVTSSGAASVSGPYLVVENVRFFGLGGGPGCDAVAADITNYGDAEQPFGWSWTIEIPKLRLSSTFFGQQPLAPGETRMVVHNPGVTEPGTYRVKISVGDVAGRTKAAGATLVIPC